jgi:putative membrane protein insertion efficiency factor
MKTLLVNLWLMPRNAFIAFIVAWRKIISPLYGDVCRFYPSCSAYGLGSIQQHGLVKGSVLTTWRILRCNPFSKGGVDEVAPGPKWFGLSKHGFVFAQLATVSIDKDK